MVTVRYSTTVFLCSKWHNNGGYEEGHASHRSGASDFQDTDVIGLARFGGRQDVQTAGKRSYKSSTSPKPSEIVQRFKFKLEMPAAH